MNLPTRTEKAVISRLKNGLHAAAMDLLESEFVSKDKESPYNWVGEFMDANASSEIMSELLNKYPELAEQLDSDYNCSLYHAARCHRVDVIKEIVGLGVDINRDLNGFGNCLNVAARFDSKVTMNSLVSFGADPSQKNDRGDSPLDISQRWGNYENVDFFETLKAKPSVIEKLRKENVSLQQEFTT